MFLELSNDKIMIVLELSGDDSRPNSMLCKTHFVDHFLSLIISFLDSQASLVLTTTKTCSLNSASSLTLVCLLEVGHPA
jgi:hypothetical protein